MVQQKGVVSLAEPNRALIRAAANAPYLEAEQEHELAQRWVGRRDQEALHQLTTAHMRLVIAMAARFRRYGLAMNDLVQEGHVGLLEAAARFDPDRGVRFSTYATWWIRAAIQDFVLRNWSIVRGGTSSAQKSLFFSLRRLRARISRRREDMSSQELYRELANAFGVKPADVASMDARLSAPDLSLNLSISEDSEEGAERVEFLVDDQPLPDENAQDSIDGRRRKEWLGAAIDVLSEREKRIVARRRLDEESATLEELGEELGISKERVRQLEARALEKLRAALISSNPRMAGHQ
jgi:RNA polymerase sigma-32 factor